MDHGVLDSRGLAELIRSLGESPTPVHRVAVIGTSSVARVLRSTLTGGTTRRIETHDDVPDELDVDLCLVAMGDDRPIQMAALRAASAVVSDTTILVSTSPVISIEELTASLTGPERVISFVPAEPLAINRIAEVVRGEATSDATLGAVLRLCETAGFLPLVQLNGGPTLIFRMFGAVALAALDLAARSGDPARVDAAACEAGVSIGPLRVLDSIGLDRARVFTGREDQWPSVEAIYEAPDSTAPHPTFAAIAANEDLDDATLASFYKTTLIEAGRQAMADGIVQKPQTLWLAATYGLGVAPTHRDWWMGREFEAFA